MLKVKSTLKIVENGVWKTKLRCGQPLHLEIWTGLFANYTYNSVSSELYSRHKITNFFLELQLENMDLFDLVTTNSGASQTIS